MDAIDGQPAVVVMAKAPRPGRVKTRLCPPLSPSAAARLYGCFLSDTMDVVRAVKATTPVLAYAPTSARAFFRSRCPDFLLVLQRGRDLGSRLASAFASVFAGGAPAVAAIGGDTPTLPATFISRAIALLTAGGRDVVLGPSADGGYYLVGLRAPRPELFDGIPWSTPHVAAETLRRAAYAGLRVACLPPWSDVDTPADLAALATALRADASAAPHTRRFLARLRWAAA